MGYNVIEEEVCGYVGALLKQRCILVHSAGTIKIKLKYLHITIDLICLLALCLCFNANNEWFDVFCNCVRPGRLKFLLLAGPVIRRGKQGQFPRAPSFLQYPEASPLLKYQRACSRRTQRGPSLTLVQFLQPRLHSGFLCLEWLIDQQVDLFSAQSQRVASDLKRPVLYQ